MPTPEELSSLYVNAPQHPSQYEIHPDPHVLPGRWEDMNEDQISDLCNMFGMVFDGWWQKSSGQKAEMFVIWKSKKAKENRKIKPPETLFLETPLDTAFWGQLRFNDVAGEIGLEIECEGKSLFNSPISYWQAVADHSLRSVDGHPPLEYVLRAPVHRNSVRAALNYLENGLKKSGSELKMSHRTSVHVHINCLKLKVREIIQFLCLYFIFEDLLVEFSGQDREGNLFCLRAKDAEYQIECLTTAVKTYNFGEAFNQNLRYSACNTSSLANHGSLEFRSMRGTVDKTLIQNWVDLLLAIKDKALSYKSPVQMAEEFVSLGPVVFADRFTSYLCPETRTWIMNHPTLKHTLWSSFRTMRDLAYAIDWDDPPRAAPTVRRQHYPNSEDEIE